MTEAASLRSAKLAFFTLGSTVAYLGLAILGRGGFSAFFSHPALVALAIATCVLAAVALFSPGNLSAGEREDRSNRWVLLVFGVIGWLLAYLPAYTDQKEFWTFDGDSIRWVGLVLFAGGGALRIWPVFELGRKFSGLVAIQQGHALVTDGMLRPHPAPELPGAARQLARVGARFSFGSWPSAHGAPDPATPCAHTCGRGAAAHSLRRQVRRLPRPHVTACSWALLGERCCRAGFYRSKPEVHTGTQPRSRKGRRNRAPQPPDYCGTLLWRAHCIEACPSFSSHTEAMPNACPGRPPIRA